MQIKVVPWIRVGLVATIMQIEKVIEKNENSIN